MTSIRFANTSETVALPSFSQSVNSTSTSSSVRSRSTTRFGQLSHSPVYFLSSALVKTSSTRYRRQPVHRLLSLSTGLIAALSVTRVIFIARVSVVLSRYSSRTAKRKATHLSCSAVGHHTSLRKSTAWWLTVSTQFGLRSARAVCFLGVARLRWLSHGIYPSTQTASEDVSSLQSKRSRMRSNAFLERSLRMRDWIRLTLSLHSGTSITTALRLSASTNLGTSAICTRAV